MPPATDRYTRWLRNEAERAYARVRRDRGRGLYLAAKPKDPGGAGPFLSARDRGGMDELSPSAEAQGRLLALLPPCPDAAMARFRSGAPAEDDLPLLNEGLKLLEAGCTSEQAAAYRREVHARAAVLLRTGRPQEGGTLYMCAQISAVLDAD